ncbi:hypothetical protein G7092_22190 [Mucilaginibacter sp. HC2]|uniref:hypothetical protein n=1 Tax=Mucilaginibacter inviolabilis TaxID=2714892 RepID=UPI00140CD94E|nr:hypothetical protein [Mucilaginibacter inviolabilis]NHA06535.1 hypothetical protein [Mucilaginibacter inviolabilis]
MNNKLCDQSITNLFINHQKKQQSALNKFVTSGCFGKVLKTAPELADYFIKKVGLHGLHFLQPKLKQLSNSQSFN